jgi:hypothetical protein
VPGFPQTGSSEPATSSFALVHREKGNWVHKYLSQEWLDEFRSLADDQPTRPGATVKIQYHVTGGPQGDVQYYWILDEGKITDIRIGTI